MSTFKNTEMVDVFLDIGDDASLNVGKLAYHKKQIYFEYSGDFLSTRLQISPYKLPLKSGLQVCDDRVFEGLFGVFADSLPDGWGRLLVDRHFRKLGVQPMSLTPLDRLLMVGKFGMGALRYMPDNSSDVEQILGSLVLDELADESLEVLDGDSDLVIDKLLSVNGSSCGARPKAVIQTSEDKTTVVHGAQKLKANHSHWIVKFPSSKDSKFAGHIEYAYSLMAKKAGVEMPDAHLFKCKSNSYFAAQRFDRYGDTKVHMHSLAGLVHADFRIPSLDYDDILALTYDLTKSVAEVEKAFRLACFNILTHNKDSHAKNFSYLMRGGHWYLSPAYDITFSSGPGNEHSTSLFGKGKDITINDIAKLGAKYNVKNAEKIVADVASVVKEWGYFADIAGVPSGESSIINKSLKFIS